MRTIVRSTAIHLAALVALFIGAKPAMAGPYSDSLAKCLVKSTTAEDKSVLVQWIFAIAALHPDVRRLSSTSNVERDELNKRIASLFETLLTDSCLLESREALKYEGPSTMETSFGVLGNVASRELFSNSSVATGMSEMAKHFNHEKLQKALAPR